MIITNPSPLQDWAYPKLLTEAQSAWLKILSGIDTRDAYERLPSNRTLYWLLRQGFITAVDGKPQITELGERVISEDIDRKEAAYFRQHPDEIDPVEEEYYRDRFGIVR